MDLSKIQENILIGARKLAGIAITKQDKFTETVKERAANEVEGVKKIFEYAKEDFEKTAQMTQSTFARKALTAYIKFIDWGLNETKNDFELGKRLIKGTVKYLNLGRINLKNKDNIISTQARSTVNWKTERENKKAEELILFAKELNASDEDIEKISKEQNILISEKLSLDKNFISALEYLKQTDPEYYSEKVKILEFKERETPDIDQSIFQKQEMIREKIESTVEELKKNPLIGDEEIALAVSQQARTEYKKLFADKEFKEKLIDLMTHNPEEARTFYKNFADITDSKDEFKEKVSNLNAIKSANRKMAEIKNEINSLSDRLKTLGVPKEKIQQIANTAYQNKVIEYADQETKRELEIAIKADPNNKELKDFEKNVSKVLEAKKAEMEKEALQSRFSRIVTKVHKKMEQIIDYAEDR